MSKFIAEIVGTIIAKILDIGRFDKKIIMVINQLQLLSKNGKLSKDIIFYHESFKYYLSKFILQYHF